MRNNRGIAHLFLLVVVIFVAIGAVGYLAYQNAQSKNHELQTSKPAVSVNLGDDLEKVLLLKMFNGVAVFHTVISDVQDGDYSQYSKYIQKLYVADIHFSRNSVKEVFSKSDSPWSQIGSIYRLYGKHYYYFIAQIEGEGSDLAIFKQDGELITQSVRESNQELIRWSVNFDKYDPSEEVVIASLVTMANDSGTVKINPETGKVVPNSLQELGKLEN